MPDYPLRLTDFFGDGCCVVILVYSSNSFSSRFPGGNALAIGVILKTATDVDPIEYFVIAIVGLTQVLRHGFGGVEVGDSLAEKLRQRGEEVRVLQKT